MPPIKTKQTISENLTIACKIKADHYPQFGEDLFHAKTFSIFHHKLKFDQRMVLWTRLWYKFRISR